MTYAYLGPHAPDRDTRFAGNNLACSNCHLEAGTKKFGLPIYGLAFDFPRYSARTGAEISIEDRINSCMTRSMNGRPLPVQSPDMQALAAYVNFLSTGVTPGEQIPGHGAGAIPNLDRAADPKHGKLVYARACLDCHNTNGSGIARSPQALSLGYAVPPLWGADSFNDGAGMARLITLANFLHSNMPHGPIIGTRCCRTKRPGMWRPMSNCKRGRIKQGLSTIFLRTCSISRLIPPMGLTPIIFPRRNINMDPFNRSALKSRD